MPPGALTDYLALPLREVHMYQDFEVRHFRGLRHIRLDNLSRFNIITGINNVGKTALLEAMFLHSGGYSIQSVLQINAFRGLRTQTIELSASAEETPWNSIFTNFDMSLPVQLAAHIRHVAKTVQFRSVTDADELRNIGPTPLPADIDSSKSASSSLEGTRVLALDIEEDGREDHYYQILTTGGIRVEPSLPAPSFPSFYTSSGLPGAGEEAQYFGKLQVAGQDRLIVNVLRVIEPQLERVVTILVGPTPILHGDIGHGRLLPLALMGAGMSRVAHLATYIANAPGGIVFIDEIENGLHYSALPKVWAAVAELARELDVQVVATTHSRECIAAARVGLRHGADSAEDLRLYRIEETSDGQKAAVYDEETLAAAFEAGLEVR
jgi:AAA domain, putative AbiEii toxin, Type IV TA system